MKINNLKNSSQLEKEVVKRYIKKDKKKKSSMKVSGASVKRLAGIISKKG